MKSTLILILSTLVPLTTLIAEEHWSCESPIDDPSNYLEIIVDNDALISYDYTSSTPSPDGDTKFLCSFSAKRNDKDSTWKEKKGKTIVKSTYNSTEKDRTVITKNGNTFIFEFKMSPTNCGHSTPFASTISISKDKKECHHVEYE